MFAASCIGIALLATLLEALRRLSRDYDASLSRSLIAAYAPGPPSVDSDVKAKMAFPLFGRRPRITALQQLLRTVLHVVIFGVAYLLMLLAMYYNGYIIISILLGTGLGKFLCDWMELGDGSFSAGAGKVDDDPTVCCG